MGFEEVRRIVETSQPGELLTGLLPWFGVGAPLTLVLGLAFLWRHAWEEQMVLDARRPEPLDGGHS